MSLAPILTTSEEIIDLAQLLSKETVIAVDLEADSMHNYREKVCLLQFSTTEQTVLVDPLAGADLTPLKAILADPDVRKIFHAADYDIRCLARDFDIEINGLFDTMVSSQLLGSERFGLADVLKGHLDIDVDKQYQRADWSRRPLTEGMIRYAAGDTCYLHRLSEIIERLLQEKGRLEWAQEEFELLEQVRFAVHDGPMFLRIKGAGTLSRRQLAVLEALLQWRDQEARRRDCPLYKVIGNKPLLALAKAIPAGKQAMNGIDGLPPRLLDRYANKLLAAVAEGKNLSDADLPHYPHRERKEKDPQAEKRLLKLKDWRKKAAAQLELDPGVLINNASLEALATKHPGSVDELEQAAILKNWQRKVLGEGIIKVLN